MVKRKKREILGECAYCPNRGITKDHIPPQSIFATGTQNKPWVPACQNCNGGASKDDQYLQRLAMLWGADGSKDAVAVEERFLSSLQREEAKGLQADVLASLSPLSQEEELMFPEGIKMAYRVSVLGESPINSFAVGGTS